MRTSHSWQSYWRTGVPPRSPWARLCTSPRAGGRHGVCRITIPFAPSSRGHGKKVPNRHLTRARRRPTIVGVPPSAVPNFAQSLIVVARRGFSDAARRSIVWRGYEPCMLTERWRGGSFFARVPTFSGARNAMSAYKRVVSRDSFHGTRHGACSDTANKSVPWKESLQETTRLFPSPGGCL